MKREDDCGSSIPDLLRPLFVNGEFSLDLFDICLSISRRHQRKTIGDDQENDADSDALDFIYHLSQGPPRGIECRRGLEKEFARFITRFKSKASSEVWRKVSEALTKLAREGRIRRLTGGLDEKNTNETLYSAVSEELDHHAIDLKALDEIASHIPALTAKRRVESRANRKPSLATPSEMRELTFSILIAAEMPVALCDLRKVVEDKLVMAVEKQNYVDTGFETETNVDSNHDAPGLWTMDTIIFLDYEAVQRADRIWENLASKSNRMIDLLCGYLLPKWLTDEKVTYSKFGSPQRVQEEIEEAKDIMARELPDPNAQDKAPCTGDQRFQDAETSHRQAAVFNHAGKVFDLLTEKCSENCGNEDFNSQCKA